MWVKSRDGFWKQKLITDNDHLPKRLAQFKLLVFKNNKCLTSLIYINSLLVGFCNYATSTSLKLQWFSSQFQCRYEPTHLVSIWMVQWTQDPQVVDGRKIAARSLNLFTCPYDLFNCPLKTHNSISCWPTFSWFLDLKSRPLLGGCNYWIMSRVGSAVFPAYFLQTLGQWYCWWKKSCTSWGYPIFLQGFIDNRWCRISSINSMSDLSPVKIATSKDSKTVFLQTCSRW